MNRLFQASVGHQILWTLMRQTLIFTLPWQQHLLIKVSGWWTYSWMVLISACCFVRSCDGWYKAPPPFIIFRGTETRHVLCKFTVDRLGYLQVQFYTVQDKARVNTQVFLGWVICVWAPYAGNFNDGTYLLMDEFSVHMKSECIVAIHSQGLEVNFIAGGCIEALQILDKGVNKPFKWHVRDAALMWVLANQDTVKPSRVDVLRKGIEQAWNRITAESITITWNSGSLHGYNTGGADI